MFEVVESIGLEVMKIHLVQQMTVQLIRDRAEAGLDAKHAG